MATLLIRGLDEGVKKALRIQAAENGRSMEEEARQILAQEMRRTAEARTHAANDST